MYEFTEDCLTNIEQIDNEHKHLFLLLNESIELISRTEDVTIVANNLIEKLKDYAANHFKHEEDYMESISDPELPLQKREHAAFTQRVNSFSIDNSSAEAAKESVNELLQFLVRWLYKHILSSDIMIGKFETEDKFAFTAKYKTDIELIDNEHRHLFEIIKNAYDLIFDNILHDKYDKIMEVLSELKEYTKSHFHDEEQLMEKINYPGLEMQKHAHDAFIEKLVDIDLDTLDDIDNNQHEYLTELINYLLNWLSNHILGSDKKIGEYVKDNKITL